VVGAWWLAVGKIHYGAISEIIDLYIPVLHFPIYLKVTGEE